MKFHTSPLFAAFLLASPHLSAGQTVTSVWFPEGGPATITPAPVMAYLDGTPNRTFFSLAPQNTSDSKFWKGMTLAYLTTTVLNITYESDFHRQTCPETICTGTNYKVFIKAACTSMSDATTARCTGSYGSEGWIWTSTMPYKGSTSTRPANTEMKSVSTLSDVRPFPSEPRVTNMLALTITKGSIQQDERPTRTATSSSSTGGVWAPRQTCNKILVGAAAAAAGGAALLL
ncbi:hypothetical protein RB595_008028 [Gaeumannomyces hyphopodioides]